MIPLLRMRSYLTEKHKKETRHRRNWGKTQSENVVETEMLKIIAQESRILNNSQSEEMDESLTLVSEDSIRTISECCNSK